MGKVYRVINNLINNMTTYVTWFIIVVFIIAFTVFLIALPNYNVDQPQHIRVEPPIVEVKQVCINNILYYYNGYTLTPVYDRRTLRVKPCEDKE